MTRNQLATAATGATTALLLASCSTGATDGSAAEAGSELVFVDNAPDAVREAIQ